MTTRAPKTPEIAIVCPDCKHPILWDGRTWHDGEDMGCSKSGCNCELDQNQALAKWIEQDRAATRRAALLEAAKVECVFCASSDPQGPFEFTHKIEKTALIPTDWVFCTAHRIHALLAKPTAQEQVQAGGEGGGNG